MVHSLFMMKRSENRSCDAAFIVNCHLAWFIRYLLLGFCLLCATCAEKDDETTIRALIDKGAVLAETHDIAAILDLTTGDVRAMPLDLDRRGIKAILWRTFNYYGPLRILYPRPSIEVKGEYNEASAQIPFLIVKKEQTIPDLEGLRDDPVAWIEALGDAADLYRIRLVLARQNGDWLIDQVFLNRFTGVGFEE